VLEVEHQNARKLLRDLSDELVTQEALCTADGKRVDAFLAAAATREEDIARASMVRCSVTWVVHNTIFSQERARAAANAQNATSKAHEVASRGCPGVSADTTIAESLIKEADLLRHREVDAQLALDNERRTLEQARRAVAETWELGCEIK